MISNRPTQPAAVTYVEELDRRSGHRKAALLIPRGGVLTPQAQVGMQAQLQMWGGLSGEA